MINEIYITGKGPSFDNYKPEPDHIIIALNETALLLENPFAAFALDRNVWAALENKISCTSFIPKYLWNEFSPKFKNTVMWDKLRSGDATAPCAIRWFGEHYDTTIMHFIGFDAISDGLTKNAKRGKPYSKKCLEIDSGTRTSWEYRTINKRIFLALKEYNITPIWHHTDQEIINPFLKEEDRENNVNIAS